MAAKNKFMNAMKMPAIADMNGINAAHDIYISGGTVTAKGGYNGAGIGGGQYVPARNITVTGGVVTATGHYGAAIGGGRWCRGMDIRLPRLPSIPSP